jgi:hypothetical protein
MDIDFRLNKANYERLVKLSDANKQIEVKRIIVESDSIDNTKIQSFVGQFEIGYELTYKAISDDMIGTEPDSSFKAPINLSTDPYQKQPVFNLNLIIPIPRTDENLLLKGPVEREFRIYLKERTSVQADYNFYIEIGIV